MRDDMRKAAEWTTQADERILEFLLNNGTHPSSAIGHLINGVCDGVSYSRPHISRRCKILSEYGLLTKHYQHYTLTDDGEAFLRGNLDAATLTRTATDE